MACALRIRQFPEPTVPRVAVEVGPAIGRMIKVREEVPNKVLDTRSYLIGDNATSNLNPGTL